MTFATIPDTYQAVLEGAAMFDENSCGRIWMRGRDRAALLHRLSTNEIVRLRPGQGARTVLTSPIGRIIDLLTVHVFEDALLVVTSPDQGPQVFGLLRKNIFFQDQVTLEPAGRTHAQLALYGPRCREILAHLGAAELADVPLHALRQISLAEADVLVAPRPPLGGDGLTLYIPTEALESVQTLLQKRGVAALDAGTFDTLRVEQGYGAFGRELSQEYIPLETDLTDAVSFTKGCYVGQEIIARMESRGRRAKQLRGLRLLSDQSAAAWPPSLPGKLAVDGKDAGDLTSAVVSPRFGAIGLGYVRSAHAEPGTQIGVNGTDLRVEVVELPFAR